MSSFRAISISAPSYVPSPPTPFMARPMDKPWHARAIDGLSEWEKTLNRRVENCWLQARLDRIGVEIQRFFEPLERFNRWLHTDKGSWGMQLGLYVAKLPVKAAFNGLYFAYLPIQGCVFLVVHPVRAVILIAKFVISSIIEISKPAMWINMGAGFMGRCVGQSLCLSNPIPLVSLVLGAVFCVVGLAVDGIQTSFQAKSGEKLTSVKEHLIFQLKQIPESFMTQGYLVLVLCNRSYRINALVTNPSSGVTKTIPMILRK